MASSTCVVTTEEKQLIERNRLKTVVKRGRNGSQNGSKRKNMSQMVSKKRSSGRCCSCAMTGTCLRYSCVMKGTPCSSCVPSRYGRCLNGYLAVNVASDNESERSDGDGDGNELGRCLAMQKGMFCEDGDSIGSQLPLQEKAFGGVMLNSDGGDSDDKWLCRWKQLVSLFGSLYDLPGRNVGKKFVGLLADEISMLSEKRVNSERFIVFCRVVLQRDRLVKKGSDVRRLIKRRIDAWKNDNFDELVQETIRCVRQSVRRRKETLSSGFDHVVQVFTRLMWRGEVRAAARWITERGSNGVMLPTDLVDGSTDKTVMDVLKEKHPDPGMIDESVCLEDDDLPVLMDVDVTGGHIERLARALHGGAGPGGTTSSHWQSFLLCYGAQSAKLRDAVAALTCLLANGIINWDMIRAMLSSRLIALDKNPGIRPIGVGEVLRRLLGKAMALATGIDVEELCGADQLCSGLKGGIEGAIHSVGSIFESKSHEGYGVLVVDAKNAFNSEL